MGNRARRGKPPLMPVTDDLSRYRDIERIGAGGMATVTLAEDTMLRRRVALKRVHAGGDAQAIPRLRREALVGASLSHPNLVSIYDVEIGEDGDLVIVMEYIEGETLRDAIDRAGGLPPAFAVEVLSGVAAALDTIHERGIVHRDVKPANILLGREGAIKLADLGIAVAADRTQITNAGVILGTFSYMAPEQLEGSAATPAVDVYALAVVAYEMLSGEKARPQTNPVALAHAIATRPPPDLCAAWAKAPPAAAAVLMRGMAADPGDRPRSAGELVERLRAALEPERRTAPVPPPRPARPPAPRPRPAPPRAQSPAPEPLPVPASSPALAPAPAAPRLAARVPLPAATGRGIAEGLRGKRPLILAALAALGLGVVALALIDSGSGGAPARRTAASTGGSHAAARTTATGTSVQKTTSTSAGRSGGVTGSGAAASASTGGAAGAATGNSGGGGVTANPTAATPAGAVQAFYGLASRHDYASAWALADPAFRAQLRGYQSFAGQQSQVRSLTFQRAQTVQLGPSSATVAVSTTPVLDSGTQHCQGSVRVVRTSSGGWMLDQISINCV
ncbi:MAG: eukaryotic-like serine/threonine-protein kinase [Solirubrobacteraceae bacterium]|nr:eukaryotic-like serine/threonine-protein kinase [Solirubrobacteraceae bacterium]